MIDDDDKVYGISASGEGIEIYRNRISNGPNGILAVDAPNCSISDNKLENISGVGIDVARSPGARVERNAVTSEEIHQEGYPRPAKKYYFGWRPTE